MKIAIVYSCRDCPNYSRMNDRCERVGNIIKQEDNTTIPDWCNLYDSDIFIRKQDVRDFLARQPSRLMIRGKGHWTELKNKLLGDVTNPDKGGS